MLSIVFSIFFFSIYLNKISESYILNSGVPIEIESTNSSYEQQQKFKDIALFQRASCKCKNGDCVEIDGETVCKCWSDYGVIDRDSANCGACNCGKESSCTITTRFFRQDDVKCICKEGYEVHGQTCVGPCTENPCKNSGSCVDIKGGYKCNCTDGFLGEHCEKKQKTIITTTSEISTKDLFSSSRFETSRATPKTSFATKVKITIDDNNSSEEITEFTKSSAKIEFETIEVSTSLQTAKPTSVDYEISDFTTISTVSESKLTTTEIKNTFSSSFSDYSQEITKLDTSTSYPPRNVICKVNFCENGGICIESGKLKQCICSYPYGGFLCRDSYWCSVGFGKTYCPDGKCHFNFTTNVGRCECSGNFYFNYEKKKCEEMCNSRICKNGECELKNSISICRCHDGYSGLYCENEVSTDSNSHEMKIVLIVLSSLSIPILMFCMCVSCKYLAMKRRHNKSTYQYSNAINLQNLK